jgi:hypothetical protein
MEIGWAHAQLSGAGEASRQCERNALDAEEERKKVLAVHLRGKGTSKARGARLQVLRSSRMRNNVSAGTHRAEETRG